MSSGKQYRDVQTALQGSSPDINAASDVLTSETARIWQDGGSADDVEKSLWQTWHTVTTLAGEIPHDKQDGLVDAVKAIQQAGELKRDDNEIAEAFGSSAWTDLPVFGAQIREVWNGDASTERWTNLNAFVARLTAASAPYGPYDFALYGIWSLREAIETEAAQQQRYGSIPAKALDAAAIWFVYAAQKLREQSNSSRAFDGKLARAGDGVAGKEWTGYSSQRWDLWKETLQAIAASEEQNGDKALLQRALKALEAAEQ